MARPGSSFYRHRHVFRVIDRPRRLVLATTESRPDAPGLEIGIEFTFEPQDGRTLMTMIQTGFPTTEVRDEHARGARRPSPDSNASSTRATEGDHTPGVETSERGDDVADQRDAIRARVARRRSVRPRLQSVAVPVGRVPRRKTANTRPPSRFTRRTATHISSSWKTPPSTLVSPAATAISAGHATASVAGYRPVTCSS